MNERLKLLMQYYVYWYIIFMLERLIFLIYNYDYSLQYRYSELLWSLAYGSRMDWALTGYILIPAVLFCVGSVFFQAKYLKNILHYYTLFWLVLSAFLCCADAELYQHWGSKLDSSVLGLLNGDNTIFNAIPMASLVKTVPLFVGIIILGGSLYRFVFPPRINALHKTKWYASLYLLGVSSCLILPIRGTFEMTPFNIGFVYFHKKPFPNHVAVNATWNMLNSFRSFNKIVYEENYFDQKRTKEVFTQLTEDKGHTISQLKNKRPNIVLIIWEGLNAQIVENMVGKEKGVTPRFDAFVKEGILFRHLFSTGSSTNIGVPGILSAYPSQTRSLVIKNNRKLNQLDYLSKDLSRLGYYTAFVFGNHINYSNFNSYLNIAGFDLLLHKESFPSVRWTTKWGVHDEFVFERIEKELEVISKQTQPFFLSTLTLSSHEPFDVPLENPPFKGEGQTSEFLNSYYYADREIGEFIDYLKAQPYWDNTLVIITGDHGTQYREKVENHSTKRHHIPMLWLGGALKTQGIKIDTYGSQTDIAPTILAQLGDHKKYKFGKNLFSTKVKSYAFYTYGDGYVFLNDSCRIRYDNNGKRYSQDVKKIPDTVLEIPKAYLQTLYSDYNKLGELPAKTL